MIAVIHFLLPAFLHIVDIDNIILILKPINVFV